MEVELFGRARTQGVWLTKCEPSVCRSVIVYALVCVYTGFLYLLPHWGGKVGLGLGTLSLVYDVRLLAQISMVAVVAMIQTVKWAAGGCHHFV